MDGRDLVDPFGSLRRLARVLTLHHDNNHYLNTLWLVLVGAGRSPLLYRVPAIVAAAAMVAWARLRPLRRGAIERALVALLLSGSYLLVHYGSEARGYSLAMFLGLGAYQTMDLYLSERRARWALAFPVVATLAILSHLTVVFILLGAAGGLLPAGRAAAAGTGGATGCGELRGSRGAARHPPAPPQLHHLTGHDRCSRPFRLPHRRGRANAPGCDPGGPIVRGRRELTDELPSYYLRSEVDMLLWICRGLVLLWCVYVFIHTRSAEEARWAKYGLVVPALAVLAVVEFFGWRSRVRQAMRQTAERLGLSFRGGVFSATLEGMSQGYPVAIRTEQSNEVGKGTCLEIRLGRPTELAVGPSRIKRRLKKATTGGNELAGLPPSLATAKAYGDASWASFLRNPEHAALVSTFVTRWHGAILNDRIVACDMSQASDEQFLASFLGTGLEIAKHLSDPRR